MKPWRSWIIYSWIWPISHILVLILYYFRSCRWFPNVLFKIICCYTTFTCKTVWCFLSLHSVLVRRNMDINTVHLKFFFYEFSRKQFNINRSLIYHTWLWLGFVSFFSRFIVVKVSFLKWFYKMKFHRLHVIFNSLSIFCKNTPSLIFNSS